MLFAIKAAISDPRATEFSFPRQKTMYKGKSIGVGDTVYVFASENEGGRGLIAKGRVIQARAIPLDPSLERQTPRVSVRIRRTKRSRRQLGRAELKPWCHWKDGRAETELNFKFYRQATNKIVAISDAAARFLERHF
jgi:hypothetical protein